MLAQRAQGSKLAKAKQAEEEDAAAAQAKTAKKVAPAIANANAALVEGHAARASDNAAAPVMAEQAQPFDTQLPKIQLVSAEQFNDLDRAAWDANQGCRS